MKFKSLTPTDWKKIWDEIEDKESDNVVWKFQDDMRKKHGAGHYYMDDETCWKYLQAFIQRVVNKRIKEKNTCQSK
jgi:hypothetical protein